MSQRKLTKKPRKITPDLKAENDALKRQLEIEAALEKVRERTMKMRSSEELYEIAKLLYRELHLLGIVTFSCGYVLIDEEKDHGNVWMTNPEGGLWTVPLSEERVLKDRHQSWKKKDHIHRTDLSGQDLNIHLKYIAKHSPLTPAEVEVFLSTHPADLVLTSAHFSHGYLLVVSEPPVTGEDQNMFIRFAKVFEMTYRRYLDLKRAEEQARESQIEAALERVRAATIGMHKSEELVEVATILYNQLLKLSIDQVAESSIVIFDQPNNQQVVWTGKKDADSLEMSTLPLIGDHVLQSVFDAWRKKESFFAIKVGGTELENHQEFVLPKAQRTKEEDRALAEMPDPTNFNCAFFSKGYLELITANEINEATESILCRFAKVFEQTYTRFLDLKKAEEQAREAEIELALERIRARTMAMHHSDELPEAAQLLFHQVQQLGINAWSVGYNIWNEDKTGFISWMSDEGVLQPVLEYPVTEDPSMKHFLEAQERGETFFVEEVGGKALVKHYEYLRTLPGVADSLDMAKAAGFSVPTFQIFHLAYFSKGFLLFITYEPVPEAWDIFKRFGKVFEQTYTRFLDLKKAEEQAREAQIEAALERIRSRALAMHSSDEILEVADVLREQMGLLGQPELAVSAVHIYAKGSETFDSWWAFVPTGKRKKNILTGISKIRIHTSALAREFIEKHQSEQSEYTIYAKGKKLRDWQKEVAVISPEQIESYGQQLPKECYFHFSDFTGGALAMVSYQEPSQESKDLQKRSASVFNLAYQRFLDLQKAEEQAREAEIELALERVRARAMAMHRSEELAEAAELLYQQLCELGLDPWTCGYVFIEEEKDVAKVWMTEPNGKFFWGLWSVPHREEKVLIDRYNSWKRREKIHRSILRGQDNIDHHIYIVEHAPFSPNEKKAFLSTLPVDLVLTSAHFSHGYLMVITEQILADEQEHLLTRFAKVFELTYQRFLDLKKAEEQAREAQIEAALERVRARAMAMHSSEELYDVALVLREQMGLLGQTDLEASVIHLYPEDADSFESWYAMRPPGKKGKIVQGVAKFSYKKSAVAKECIKAFRSKATEYTLVAKGEKLKEWLGQLAQQAPEIIKYFKGELPEQHVYHFSDFSGGSLLMVTHTEPTNESKYLQKRAASVFDLAYKRFLDLKKAEDQAREAEIELALERIRARTMAMQHSSELADASLLLAQQVKALGIETWGCAFHIYDQGSNTATEWFSNDEAALPTYLLKRENIFLEYYREGQKGETLYIKKFEGKACQKHYQYLCSLPVVGEALKDMKARGIPFPSFQIDHVAYFKYGHLLFITFEPVPEAHEIFERFAKVFEQTYTRFLDLQKAEEQAREAQIEAALERVRSRTMGMQRSEELQDAALLLFQQVEVLGLPTFACGFNIWDPDRKAATAWMAGKDRLQPPFKTSSARDIFNRIHKAAQKGESLFVEEQGGDALKTHYEYMNSIPVFKEMADKMAAAGQSFPTFQVVHCAYFSHGYLMFISFEPVPSAHDIFKRFAKVFEQTYTRFLDLRKAEEQAREAQIEAALERVRARAMAMHKSEELKEVIAIIYHELTGLGLELHDTNIAIQDESTKEITFWGSGLGGVDMPPKFTVPYLEQAVVRKVYDHGFKNGPYYWVVLKGRELKNFVQIAITQTGFKDAPKEYQDAMFSVDPLVLSQVAIKHGFLEVASDELLTVDQAAILQRFGSVVDLTYTRFDDVVQAENQAREAQIEASLERVRAASMAMHHSHELSNVAGIIIDQLGTLGLNMDSSMLHEFVDDSGDLHFWAAAVGADYTNAKRIHLPYCNHPLYSGFKKARKQRIPFWASSYTRNEKDRFFDHFYKCDPQIPKKRREYIASRPGMCSSTAFGNYTAITVNSYSNVPFPEEENKIITRFSQVFEQSYTRFLDLKTAEAQAREAQIEAALERVRNRTLLMRDSNELNEAVAVFFKEFQTLGLLPDEARTYFCHIDVNTDMAEVWMTRADGTVMSGSHHTPLTKSASMSRYYEAWKEGKPIMERNYTGKALKDYLAFVSSLPHVKKDRDYRKIFRSPPKRIVMTDANFKQGNIGIMTFQPLGQEAVELLVRFAKVFEFTYTRFLDLKKAEEQAREAQIEAALERVRAKAMAMHSSEDLVQTVGQLFKELNSLDISLLRCGVGRVHKDTRVLELYTFSTSKGDPVPVIGNAVLKGHPVLNGCFRHWEKQEEYHPVLKGTSLKKYYEQIKANYKLPGKQDSKVQYGYFFPFRVGVLFTYTETEFSEEELSIFRKFSSVVGLTYRRFLDLKEAEEQAREAQIEVALERIRARAMAMHNSDELMEVADVMREQMSLLGQPQLQTAALHIYPDEGDNFESWFSLHPKGKSDKIITMTVTFKKEETKLAREMLARYRSKDQEYTMHVRGKPLEEWRQMAKVRNPTLIRYWGDDAPGHLYWHFTDFSGGSFVMVSRQPPTEESKVLQRRVSAAFDLAYRRFLDLKKAEAQTREAQIEAALERVRAKAMAMHKSSELAETSVVLFDQFLSLGIEARRCGFALVNEEEKNLEVWSTGRNEKKEAVLISGFLNFDQHPLITNMVDAWRNGRDMFTAELHGQALQKYYHDTIRSNTFTGTSQISEKMVDNVLSTSTSEYYHLALFDKGMIYAFTEQPLNKAAQKILIRFATAFELTYRRFLDLKKAEEQAVEAQIEAALERVRSAAAAMHSSEDLFSVAEVLHDQLAGLNQKELESSLIHLYPDNLPTIDVWYSYRATDHSSKQISDRAVVAKNACSWTKKVMKLYTSEDKAYMIESKGKMLEDWYRVLEEVAPATIDYDKSGKIIIPKVLYYHFSKFSGGALLMISNEPPAEEARDMQRRAANVFDLAYRRFLDLQKAEAQAREAQIEAALERVRASTMAMHSSEDVGKATMLLFQELENLGIETLRCGVAIISEDQTMEAWASSTFNGDEVFNIAGRIDMTIHSLLKQLFKQWKSGTKVFSYELKGKDAERYYSAIRRIPSYKLPDINDVRQKHYSTGFLFKEGVLFAFSKERFTDEQTLIFQKFTNVFTLTYRRYLDLKEAEARASAAVLKSSLDRVRAEIASMRNTEDLQHITPLVWRELTSLGVPFFRCGVFIIDERSETVHMYLSTPKGEPLAALHLDFEEKEIPLVQEAINHWRTQTVHRAHWKQQQFRTFTESLKQRGLIKNLKSYQQGEKPPESLYLHQVPFKQGMLYVGNSEPLPDDQIDLIHSLADAFSVAYSRYEDFVQLEEAKQRVENALVELRSAQDQLIHSEKMASLGELTAGIAHEIQNPLNFVNNFSEVSGELIEELKEEIKAGNLEEALEIGQDLIQNIEKINHHGQRASSIVKGMLQHSRASSDVKILTDINALADEYLRLAYHGFRAKDKSFNASFKTVLADDLPKINIVPQDIGRVLLNLINNAFQAVKGVDKPEVVVTTKHWAKGIQISVIDNGPGIPDDIKDKIFQPFFTTKPAGEGTGLGLSLSYDIITKGHGGRLSVLTPTGKSGAEFVIYLPT